LTRSQRHAGAGIVEGCAKPFFALPQGGQRRLALGQVLRHAEKADDDSLHVAERRHIEQHWQAAAVLAHVGPLPFFNLSQPGLGDKDLETRLDRTRQAGRELGRARHDFAHVVDDLRRPAPNQIVPPVTQHPLGAGVELGDQAVRVGGNDTEHGAVEHRALEPAHRGQLLGRLGARALGGGRQGVGQGQQQDRTQGAREDDPIGALGGQLGALQPARKFSPLVQFDLIDQAADLAHEVGAGGNLKILDRQQPRGGLHLGIDLVHVALLGGGGGQQALHRPRLDLHPGTAQGLQVIPFRAQAQREVVVVVEMLRHPAQHIGPRPGLHPRQEQLEVIDRLDELEGVHDLAARLRLQLVAVPGTETDHQQHHAGGRENRQHAQPHARHPSRSALPDSPGQTHQQHADGRARSDAENHPQLGLQLLLQPVGDDRLQRDAEQQSGQDRRPRTPATASRECQLARPQQQPHDAPGKRHPAGIGRIKHEGVDHLPGIPAEFPTEAVPGEIAQRQQATDQRQRRGRASPALRQRPPGDRGQ
jgi:hypothetical protein